MAEGHSFNEAGRRVKAAVISYQMGDAGVDRALKGIPDDPGEGWAELTESLLRGMQAELVGKLLGAVDAGRHKDRNTRQDDELDAIVTGYFAMFENDLAGAPRPSAPHLSISCEIRPY
jgi:hypothetical protein